MKEKMAVLKVEGMHCQGCTYTISGLLRSMKGVKDARVEFENGKVQVWFDPSQTDGETLKRMIFDAGFRVG